jgi:hypothetical protein
MSAESDGWGHTVPNGTRIELLKFDGAWSAFLAAPGGVRVSASQARLVGLVQALLEARQRMET